MISKAVFEAILSSHQMKLYKNYLWVTDSFRDQGFSAIKLYKFKRPEVKGDGAEESDVTHYYMISAIVNTGVMFCGDRHLSNNILSFTPDFERAIIFELLEIFPCLEICPELRETNISEWAKYNTYKLRRIDYVFEIKKNNQQYLNLLNGGYTLRERYYTRNYYEDEEPLTDIPDEEPDIDETEDYVDEAGYTSDTQYIYYKGKSININIYHKGREIEKEKLLADENMDYDFLRIEVQVKKRKLNAIVEKFGLRGRELPYIATPEVENFILKYYVQAITGSGAYVTLDRARAIINQSQFSESKKKKLAAVIAEVSKRHSIAVVLRKIEEGEITHLGKIATVKEYLKDIQALGINPLTISGRMKKITPVSHLKNLSGGMDVDDVVLPNIVDMIMGYSEQIEEEQQHGRTYTQEELDKIDRL